MPDRELLRMVRFYTVASIVTTRKLQLSRRTAIDPTLNEFFAMRWRRPSGPL